MNYSKEAITENQDPKNPEEEKKIFFACENLHIIYIRIRKFHFEGCGACCITCGNLIEISTWKTFVLTSD